ncbi:Ribosomal protein S18 acetylase RimI [Maribacter dokdonensis]|uniref:GNAT family N-acetyltransferase n=1 Tax=Maribacter dokdonensis TaxID=320912 RepID=UPI001B143F04|nr:GNAT family N-acetyltransferase [Maribacter dokdonensis]CAG2534629.1 Ribosomal protein S18 acetylase RimI [Maribacter dokdonensis]
MNSDLIFRPAKYEDWKLTFEFKKDGLKSYVEKIWGWDEKIQKKMHKDNFDPKKTEIIQSENNEIGYLTIRTSDAEIYLENLILGKEFQNNGFGTKIMDSIIKKSEKEKKSIGLKVLKVNKKAKKFYENLGFEKISESENHYEMKKTGYNNVSYEKP